MADFTNNMNNLLTSYYKSQKTKTMAKKAAKKATKKAAKKVVKKENASSGSPNKLFFINLGGYQPNKFEEQHYHVLTVKVNRSAAFKEAKETLFFRDNHFPGAESHIDDKYGIDVDELYEIDDILWQQHKDKYRIVLAVADNSTEDELHLGYIKL